MSQFLSKSSKQKTLKYGLPFLILIVGGSFGLKEFAQLRYQFSRKSSIRPEEFEAFGVNMKKPGEVTMETEYEKVKSMDIDNWEPIRGPRPWEENTLPDKGKEKLQTTK